MCAVVACTKIFGMHAISFFRRQSSVERGFNVNQETMAENLEELGLTSLRMVYAEIVYHGGEIKDFPIPTSLLIACQSAHQKYKNDLDRWSNKQKKTTNWRIEHCKEEEYWWREPHQTTERWFGQVNYRGWGNVRCSKDEVISSESQFFQEDCRGEGKDSCWLCLFH